MHPRLAILLASALMLSACSATDAGSKGSSNGTIEWSSGGSFGGGHGGWIKADDSSASWAMPPFGKTRQTQKQLSAGNLSLETIATMSDDPLISLPAAAS